MGLYSTLLVMALLLSGTTATVKRRAHFNDTADLPCQFTNPQNISLSELVVFWQDQEKLVLYEQYLGKEKPDNVDAKYVSRTSFDRENWVLHLHRVQIKDQGLYQCFIHHKRPKGLVHIHQKNCDLSVFANFSQPEIKQISNMTGRSDINLTCSSIRGYPEPKEMYFLYKTENATTKPGVFMEKSQDNGTELYNVSISLSFLVPHETNNVSLICVLQPEPPETELHSEPFSIGPKPIDSPRTDRNHILQIAGFTLLSLVIVCWAVLLLKKLIRLMREKQQPDRSHEGHECETIRVEEEESQKTEERVEGQAPERSDEEHSAL
ncbi:T-lymphocyte activation antigen CD86 isoform X2 [Tamandua tetradactyla]